MKKDISEQGLVAGIATWIALIILAIKSAACLDNHSCDGTNLFIFAILCVGMLGPAYVVARVWSEFTK